MLTQVGPRTRRFNAQPASGVAGEEDDMTEELKTILTAILNLIAESRNPGSIQYVPDQTFFEHDQLIRDLIDKAQKA